MKYYTWTIGCQMNKAETESISACLEALGHEAVATPVEADIVVLNTCVVRQSAERKVTGTLGYLKGVKKAHPGQSMIVTGCFVNSNSADLRARYPHVDLFLKPGDITGLRQWAATRSGASTRMADDRPTPGPSGYVPIIQGCDNFCTYCIVPYRRGREKSRPLDEIVCEIAGRASRGIKEVTLVGQNVDSYGHDLPGRPDLADLLGKLNDIDGLCRIRYLTNHPKDMSDRLIAAMGRLDKVCEQVNLPAQAGDNDVLKAMRRGYTIEQYRRLVDRIRGGVPGIALSTDLIVGFPGETAEQFQRSLDLVRDIRFDNVFVAMYSPRPGTVAARDLKDDVPPAVKEERRARVEDLQTRIASEINTALLGKTLEVLVEGHKGGKWTGRTRTNKLVFFTSDADCQGRLVQVTVTATGPWSLQGSLQAS